MRVMRLTVWTGALALFAALSGPAFAESCKTQTAEGWGLTEELAKWQATDMLLLSTGNLISQNDRFSKPQHKCSFTLLGWTCKASAKVCKK